MEVALKLISGQFNPIQLNFSRFLVGGLVLIPFAVRELKKRGRKLDGKALGSFALLGLMGIAVSMSLYQLSVTRIQASVVGVLFSSNPVFVTLFAFLLLHETISKNQIAGLVLDVAGIVLIIQPWHLRLDALGVVYVLLATLLFAAPALVSAQNDAKDDPAGNLQKFQQFYRYLNGAYVDTVHNNALVESAIREVLLQLDPHSTYVSPEEMVEVKESFDGSFGGIGIEFNVLNDTVVIVNTIAGGPSAQVGLLPGDRIVGIDGQRAVGLSRAEVPKRLRGPSGTQVRLEVSRHAVKEPLAFTVTRGDIPLHTVDAAYKVDAETGYIKVNRFGRTTMQEFVEAFKGMKGVRSLILDLRGNGGGLLDQAVAMTNFFLPRGKTLVTTKGKIKQASNTYKTLREPLDLEIPLAVLVNSATASASEILAGALQDYDRAVVVGNRTFGKGLVQTTRPLPYGGTMKLTTSKYYIPSGRCVQAIDYKHRNEDGSVGRIPDSLTTVFHTAAGREVRDGGGVTPDITVKQDKLPNILFYLVNDNLIFNYATEYCLKHPTIPAPKDFKITDADYADFKAMVQKADFKYDQQTEKILKNLKEMAEFEGYLTDASDEFKALEKKLSHNLERDLDHFSKDIKEMIAVEIIKRYYYQRGSIIQQLKDDKDLKEAVGILTAPEKYKEMLSVPPVKPDEGKKEK